MIRIHLPSDLAAALGAPATVAVETASDVLGVIERVDALYSGLRQRLTEADGALRPHIAVYIGERDARRVGGSHAAVADGDDVWLLRAVSGG